MLPARRNAVSAIRRAGRRGYAAGGHGEPAHAGTHAPGHGHEVNNESFGTSFYLCMTLIPATYLLWEFSRPNTDGSPNAYTRLIAKYSEYKDTWATRNALHTQMVEQAGRDRNLFLNTPQPNHIELRFPEQLNVGSPINVPAGHGSASMEKLVAHYREQQFKDNEEKLRKQRDGEL